MSRGVGFGRCCAFELKKTRRRRHHNLPLFYSLSATATNGGEDESPIQRSPPPIRVAFTESAGRGVFATRKIGAGDLIHTAKPLLTHPSLSVLHTVCYSCLRKLKLENGDHPQAPGVRFCSDQCLEHSKGFYQVEKQFDWSVYEDYCRTQGLKYPLLVKRLACMVISGVTSAGSLDLLQPARLQPEMILKMEEEFCLLRHTFLKACVKDEQMEFLTKQWYTGVLARIRINAFRVELIGGLYEDLLLSAAASVDAEAAVGNAVYMLPSFYNHDCDPNVHILWIDNVTARLKALRDIEAGEELRICYIDASMDHDARKALLFNGFGFECNCLRCTSGD